MSCARSSGEKEVVRYDEVKLAKLEGDGRLSVIKARS